MPRGRPKGSKDSAPRVRHIKPSESRSRQVRDFFKLLSINRLTTLVDLADRTGYSRVNVNYYKSGKRMPSAAIMDDLVEALGYEIKFVRKDASPEQLLADIGLKIRVDK